MPRAKSIRKQLEPKIHRELISARSHARVACRPPSSASGFHRHRQPGKRTRTVFTIASLTGWPAPLASGRSWSIDEHNEQKRLRHGPNSVWSITITRGTS